MSTTRNIRMSQVQKTTDAWNSSNPVLLAGELGIEWLANGKAKCKVGDGNAAWSALAYLSAIPAEIKTAAPTSADTGYDTGTLWVNTATSYIYICVGTGVWQRIVTAAELASLGAGDMLASVFAADTGAGTATGYVSKALKADKLTNARQISITGDATAAGSFNGAAALALALTLAGSGVAAGTYPKVTVDAKGRVTAGQSLSAGDIPQLTLSKITDAGSAAGYAVGTTKGTVPVLTDNGKLALAMIPDAILGQLVYGGTVNAAGVCTLTDNAKSKLGITALTMASADVYEGVYFISSADGASGVPSSLGVRTGDWIVGNGSAGWAKVDNTDAVMTVNGKAGTVVLGTDDIAEGAANLYWTAARFASAFATAVAALTTDDIAEGATNKYYTDARADAAAWPSGTVLVGTIS